MGERHERALRWTVPPDCTLPDLVALIPDVTRTVVDRVDETVRYYDTADRDLDAVGVTLTRRADGVGHVWALGLSADATLTVPADGTRLPSELRGVLRGLITGRALRSIATVRSQRISHRLYGEADEPMVTVTDLGSAATTPSEPRATVAWREILIEPGTADGALTRTLRRQLPGSSSRRRGAAPLTELLSTGAPAETAADVGSLGALLHDYLREQAVRIVRGDVLIRAADVSQIHATRVAVRRYRSVLRACAPVLDPSAAVLDRELAWYAGLLGAVRDLEVAGRRVDDLDGNLPGDLPLGPAQARLRARLDARAAAARTALDRGLAGRRCTALLRALRGFPDTAVARAAALPPSHVRRFLKAQRRITRARLRAARRQPGDVTAWHRSRKAAKRTRYVAELAEPELGKRARRVARRARTVQRLLGDIQDAEIQLDLVRSTGEQAALAGDTAAVTLGALFARQLCRQRAQLSSATKLRL